MADLTDAAVREMRLFLAGTCDDVTRWLPPPQWEPAWQSEAARECGNGETGPSGEWGEHTVRTVYAGAALYLDTILRCIQAMAGALNPNVVDWPAARLLLELAGFMIMTLACGQLGLLFQVAEITWPVFSVTVEVQLLIALLPAVMVTCPLNTPFRHGQHGPSAA